MIYEYLCTYCQAHQEINRPMSEEPRRVECRRCSNEMRRVYNPPQIIGEPYHLKEGNRFQGDASDRREYDRQYNQDAREKRNDDDRKFAVEQAQRMGAEVVAPPNAAKEKSLLDMAIEKGATPRG